MVATFWQRPNSSKEVVSVGPTVLNTRFQHIQVTTTMSTSPWMKTVLHATLYGRFREILSKHRRKKIRKTNQGSNFLRGSLRKRGNVRSSMIHMSFAESNFKVAPLKKELKSGNLKYQYSLEELRKSII